MTNKQFIEEKVEPVFQAIMEDIGKHYKVSDTLSDILSDSLSEHLTTALEEREGEIAEEIEKLIYKDKKQECNCRGWDNACEKMISLLTKDQLDNTTN